MQRLLIVDDEMCVLRTLTRLLSPCFEVTAVTSADDALRLVAGGLRFDAAVLDSDLGGRLCGVDLLELLQKWLPRLGERSVVISGGPPEARHELQVAALGSRWVLKPFSNDQLKTLLLRGPSRGTSMRSAPDCAAQAPCSRDV